MTLTAEITVELTKRDVVLLKRGNTVGYVYSKPLVMSGEEIPVEFTIRTVFKGTADKARKKASRRKTKGRR